MKDIFVTAIVLIDENCKSIFVLLKQKEIHLLFSTILYALIKMLNLANTLSNIFAKF